MPAPALIPAPAPVPSQPTSTPACPNPSPSLGTSVKPSPSTTTSLRPCSSPISVNFSPCFCPSNSSAPILVRVPVPIPVPAQSQSYPSPSPSASPVPVSVPAQPRRAQPSPSTPQERQELTSQLSWWSFRHRKAPRRRAGQWGRPQHRVLPWTARPRRGRRCVGLGLVSGGLAGGWERVTRTGWRGSAPLPQHRGEKWSHPKSAQSQQRGAQPLPLPGAGCHGPCVWGPGLGVRC